MFLRIKDEIVILTNRMYEKKILTYLYNYCDAYLVNNNFSYIFLIKYN